MGTPRSLVLFSAPKLTSHQLARLLPRSSSLLLPSCFSSPLPSSCLHCFPVPCPRYCLVSQPHHRPVTDLLLRSIGFWSCTPAARFHPCRQLPAWHSQGSCPCRCHPEPSFLRHWPSEQFCPPILPSVPPPELLHPFFLPPGHLPGLHCLWHSPPGCPPGQLCPSTLSLNHLAEISGSASVPSPAVWGLQLCLCPACWLSAWGVLLGLCPVTRLSG